MKVSKMAVSVGCMIDVGISCGVVWLGILRAVMGIYGKERGREKEKRGRERIEE